MRAATVQGRAASAATTPLGSEMENYVKGGGGDDHANARICNHSQQ